MLPAQYETVKRAEETLFLVKPAVLDAMSDSEIVKPGTKAK